MKKITSLLILSTFSWFSALTNAATFNVATTPELREALSIAASNGEEDTVILADGIYKTTDDGLGTFKYLSNESNSIKLQGSSRENVVLSGDNQDQILSHISTEDSVLELHNLSFIDGYSSDNGGAVSSTYGVNTYNCKFQNNTSESSGGAIYNSANPQSGSAIDVFLMSVEDTLFDNNSAFNGGGFYTRTANVVNSTFTSNKAGNEGGGFYVWTNEGGSNNIVSNSRFENNSAATGGGFFSRAQNTKIRDNVITNNQAERGGGFYSDSAIISNSLIENNSSSQTGAGFSTSSGSSGSTITNSILKGNVNSNDLDVDGYCGGGFYARVVLVNNSIITNNAALKGGTFCSAYDVVINNSVLANNSSGIQVSDRYEGNYIYNSIFLNYSNAIISGTGGTGSPIFTISNNYIDTSKVSVPFFSSNNIFEDIDLGFKDESNEDYRLTESSDLIDVGTVDVQSVTIPDTDLDGNTRILGGSIDIGPYEFVSNRPTISDFGYTGEAKVGSPLTFFAMTLEDISSLTLTVDFGDGFIGFVEGMQFNFSSAGDYPVTLRVMNEQGAISSRTIIISVRDLTFSEKIENATEAGRQEVISNPSTYGLALASEISAAREEQIAACLASPLSCGINIPNADIDGNGAQDALTDGLLILRYSFGLTGDSLISGVVAADATRKTAEEIEAYLETLMP
jgi:predicted outer membrane repeat protein